MVAFSQLKLTVKNFKCFGNIEQGFSGFTPVNIIIGRNNSGKSTLLDALEFATSPKPLPGLGHRGRHPEFLFHQPVTDAAVQAVLNDEQISVVDGSMIYKCSPRTWARKRIVGSTLVCSQLSDGRHEFVRFDECDLTKGKDELIARQIGIRLAGQLKSPFLDLRVIRLSADRDIVPEHSTGSLEVSTKGAGLTNVVFQYQTVDRLNERLANEVLLEAINEVCFPDAEFTAIKAKTNDVAAKVSEIHLDERDKGRIPLSHIGSGLKTIVMVMAKLLIVPDTIEPRKSLSQFLFAFEEIENNLHPALQRRLFRYLRRFAIDNHSHIFITTHSNVVMDMFAADDQAQLLHVTHDRKSSVVSKIATHGEATKLLDDLGIHASDILQANAVVWVEGPSDRIYFKKWIDLWSQGSIMEGIHYQCLPFGGSLNAHLSFEDPQHVDKMIGLLRINRHAILLVDSDRRKASDKLKIHTQRLHDEIISQGGYSWITAGREVENYIPRRTLATQNPELSSRFPQKFASMIEFIRRKCTSRRTISKVQLATDITANLVRSELESTLDMSQHLNEVCRRIREWNGLPSEN